MRRVIKKQHLMANDFLCNSSLGRRVMGASWYPRRKSIFERTRLAKKKPCDSQMLLYVVGTHRWAVVADAQSKPDLRT